MLIPVILAGGTGSRLWPISRELHPKPFMRMADGESLIQKTLKRVAGLRGVQTVFTLTNRELYFKTRSEYAEVTSAQNLQLDVILEPCGRNTAPAIAMAALRVRELHGDDATMLVLPADHLIDDQKKFSYAVLAAERLARQGYMTILGIKPQHPETGFGYVELAERIDNPVPQSDVVVSIGEVGGTVAYRVKSFIEKPELERATELIRSDNVLWNAGIFCFNAGVYLQALEWYAPDVFAAALRCWDVSNTIRAPISLDEQTFALVPDISVDYAVFEKANNVAAVACSFDWSDIGSWCAVSELVTPDSDGNRATGETVTIDSTNCYIHNSDRIVATVGVHNLLIVDTPDALLIANRDDAQDVKEVVKKLKLTGHESFRLHRTVYRPWGAYTVLEQGDRFKIKRIVVNPGASLSLQMHHHRSEHWIVVSGVAKIINGDEERLVHINESTYIPAGTAHRLVNPGVLDLIMVEVQSGEYLGEDDIVRFEDSYGRL